MALVSVAVMEIYSTCRFDVNLRHLTSRYTIRDSEVGHQSLFFGTPGIKNILIFFIIWSNMASFFSGRQKEM